MKFYVGKTAARCIRCGCDDWHLVETAQSFTVLSQIVCGQCGAISTYGDLALQAPLESENSAPGR